MAAMQRFVGTLHQHHSYIHGTVIQSHTLIERKSNRISKGEETAAEQSMHGLYYSYARLEAIEYAFKHAFSLVKMF